MRQGNTERVEPLGVGPEDPSLRYQRKEIGGGISERDLKTKWWKNQTSSSSREFVGGELGASSLPE